MSVSHTLQKIVRSRKARLGLAAALIATAAWMYLPHVRYRIAGSAFINAELVRVAAPFAGRLTRELPRKGEYIKDASAVTLIEALNRDHRHLLELEGQYTASVERAQLARKQLEALGVSDAELAKRTEIYRRGMIARVGYERDEASAEKAGCLAEVQRRKDVSSRMEQLVATGLASQMRTAEALVSQGATNTRCEMAHARLKRLETEMSSAQENVFLRDGANDAPYSQQQRDRLLLRRQELEAKLLEETLQINRTKTQLAEERDRIKRISEFELLLPARHVVWSVAASPGVTVSDGQPLLDLAGCDDRFVVVELPERDFEQTKADAPALIRLIGNTEWKQGQVRRVRGSAARTDDRLLAAQVPRPTPNSITVEIALPPDDAPRDNTGFCNIGRQAEVRFERSGFSFLDNLESKVRLVLGSFHAAASK